jgi:hypothetical protein
MAKSGIEAMGQRGNIALLVVGSIAGLPWQVRLPAPPPLARHYQEGAQLVYRMQGENDGSTYAVRLHSTVRKGADGRMGEEYAFSDFVSEGRRQTLPPASQSLRVFVTLEKGGPPFVLPRLSPATHLVGPVLDLLTFYADLFLVMQADGLHEAGDHVHLPNPGTTASWADGTRVLIGEDHVDFDVTLIALDRTAGAAVLGIAHVPPPQSTIRLPADWMRAPVRDTPNNWVQVERMGDAYVASVGQETFDVVLRVRLADGVILTASMDNPVVYVARRCRDAALRECAEGRPGRTFRAIKMDLD